MKIAILGAGFTGLTAALRLLQQGHKVTVFEKEDIVGGLAAGFKQPNWDWTLEKAYHHWFTNDSTALNLAKELDHKVLTVRPKTDVWVDEKAVPFDSPLSILTFPYLPLTDRLRVGLSAAYLKIISSEKPFTDKKALPWIRKFMGENSTKLIWEPLFTGKFGEFREEIALTWFWARIKKRTPSLAYPEGGFQSFLEDIAKKVTDLGGKIKLGAEVQAIIDKPLSIKTSKGSTAFGKVLVTLPSPIFTKLCANLPEDYIKRISSIPHLSALNLILVLKKPFFKNSYWLNITDKKFPFLVLAEHTNFMDSQHYGDEHILYIGNYLPTDHPLIRLTKEELLGIFNPYLEKINPEYKKNLVESYRFFAPFAQPVVTPDYPKLIPEFDTPIPNVYLANLDMVYPWDRGTNYAIEMGEKVAQLLSDEKLS